MSVEDTSEGNQNTLSESQCAPSDLDASKDLTGMHQLHDWQVPTSFFLKRSGLMG